MTRRVRLALRVGGSILLLTLIVLAAALRIVQSQWFYDKVRDRIVTTAEIATGGHVEIKRFDFEWRTLTATLKGFTIHGTEPADGPPLLRADDIVVGLKIMSILKRDVDVALVRIDKPQAFLLIAANGTTNVPNPQNPTKADKSTAQTILDLAVGRFELNNGSAQVQGQGKPPKTQTFAAKGENLKALFTFDAATPRYHGDLSVAPLVVNYGKYSPVPVNISTTVAIETNRLVVEQSKVASGDSVIELNGRVQDFSAPVVTAEYKSKVSISQMGTLLKLKSHQSGWMTADGSATYKSTTDFAINGVVKAYDVDYRATSIDLQKLRAEAKIDGGPHTISINDFRAYALGGEITAKAEIREFERYKINGELHHFDVRQVASLATRRKLPYDAVLSGPIFSEGKIADVEDSRVIATARMSLSPSGAGIPVRGLIDAKYNGIRNTVDLGQTFVTLPNSRLDVTGILGQQLTVKFLSSNLNDLLPVMRIVAKPGDSVPVIPIAISPLGQLAFNGTVTGQLADPVIAGHLGGSGFLVQSQLIDSLTADVSASKSEATVSNGNLRQKTVSADFNGSVGLHDWSADNSDPVQAALSLEKSDLKDVLALAGQKSVPVSGTLNITTAVKGTIGNPQASADLSLTNGSIQGEPFDRLTARIDAPNRSTQTVNSRLNAGAKQIDLRATYLHSATDFLPGTLTFDVNSNNIAMNQVVTLHQREPELVGNARVTTTGSLSVTRDQNGKPTVAITKVNGDIQATGLQIAGKRLGDVSFTANTMLTNGAAPALDVKVRSNLADATITADGRWTLAGDYSGSGKLQFSNVNLDTARRLLLSPTQVESFRVGGSIEGWLDVSGPLARPELLHADLEIPKVEIHPLPDSARANGPVDLTIRNSGSIRVKLANSVVRVENAKITAEQSTFAISGSATLSPHRSLDLKVDGDVNLAILHLLNENVIASGAVEAHASVRGDFTAPQLGGSVQLRNANLAIVDVPNGLSDANGTIAFTGTQAIVRDLTAESGGGKVRFGGFASYAGGDLSFRLRAAATGVRVRYPQGVSTVADAQLNLVGSTQRSVLSGTITVDRLAFNPRTDLGSLLSSASAPPETPSGQTTGFTSSLQLDLQIQTSPDIIFESSYTESFEADANLRLRGSLTNPALLGRINVTQGDITFFGNTYTINQGSVSFFNPVRLEPILNIDLETVARGVDVTLTVSGPVSKLNVSYRSDPPLQFSDIVGLLATGRTPNDATIAARQPTAPQQSWQQMGASALVGQAIANPVAGRLQRFFGVSKLQIDPTISGITGNPQAKVTLEQQITPDITFTYITDVANAQEQVIRVEWDFSPHWSAVALRDQNGEFGVNFLYKKRFK